MVEEKSPACFCPSASHRSELGADAGEHFITTPSNTPLAHHHQTLAQSAHRPSRAKEKRCEAVAVVESRSRREFYAGEAACWLHPACDAFVHCADAQKLIHSSLCV